MSKRRGLTAALAAVILAFVALVAPVTQANATGDTFEISYDRFQSGEIVEFKATNPVGFCPTGTPYSAVWAKITDSNNQVAFEYVVGLAVNWDGVWNTRYATHVNNWTGTPGTMSMTLECRPYGQNGYVSKVHGPKTIEFTSQSTQISNTEAQIGKTVQFSSNESCEPAVPVQLTVYGKVGYSTTDSNRPLLAIRTLSGTSDSAGEWLISETLDPTKYDPANAYYVRVICDPGGGNEKKFDSYRFTMKDYEYVALGDSYSSGLGANVYNYAPYTSWDNPDCKRSTLGYPFRVASALSIASPRLVACAGAVTDDIFNWWSDAPQADQLNADTKKVTITIGGNDVGFVEVLSRCVSQGSPGFGCSNDATFDGQISDRIDALARTTPLAPNEQPVTYNNREIHSIYSVLQKIKEKAPSAKIYIAGYPEMFGSDTSNFDVNASAPGGYECALFPTKFSYSDSQWMNGLGAQLNDAIEGAANHAALNGIDATYVPPIFFAGHGHCDNQEPFLHWIDMEGGWSAENVIPESFHPNPAGYSIGYELSFWTAMN